MGRELPAARRWAHSGRTGREFVYGGADAVGFEMAPAPPPIQLIEKNACADRLNREHSSRICIGK